MEIECAYCGKITDAIPFCGAPLCVNCCQKCRKENDQCPTMHSDHPNSEQEPTLRTG